MSTVADIRLQNLERLVAEFGTLAAVAERGGTSSIYLSQIRNKAKDAKTGRPREMGSGMARKLEEGTGKPWGWMDSEHSQQDEAPKDRVSIDEAELIAAFRALRDDETSRRLLLDMAKRLALTSGDSLGGASTQAQQLDPVRKSAA